jgi:hypothetical protein
MSDEMNFDSRSFTLIMAVLETQVEPYGFRTLPYPRM